MEMENSFIAVIKAIVYGIVEGITEWLPVSSTGHLIILNSFFQTSEMYGDPFREFFLVFIQLGAILAVIVGFFKELNPINPKLNSRERKNILGVWGKIIVGVIPAGLIGVLFEALDIDAYLDNVIIVATTLFVYGVLFIIIETYRKRRTMEIQVLKEMNFYSKNHTEFVYGDVADLDYKIVLAIGCAQILSLIPGTSRSGVTILAALLLGCSRTCASKFSFYLSIPIMLGASLVKFLSFNQAGIEWSTNGIIYATVGLAFAFITSILIIKTLLRFIKKHTFIGFGYYRIALSIVLFTLIGVGLIS